MGLPLRKSERVVRRQTGLCERIANRLKIQWKSEHHNWIMPPTHLTGMLTPKTGNIPGIRVYLTAGINPVGEFVIKSDVKSQNPDDDELLGKIKSQGSLCQLGCESPGGRLIKVNDVCLKK